MVLAPSCRLRACVPALAVMALAALTGCAQRPPLVRMPEPTASVDGTQAGQTAARWSGRLTLKLTAFGAEAAQGVNVAFDLQGHAHEGQLDLSTPLGTLVAQVHWERELATLTTADGAQSFDSLEALTRQVLGEPLPVTAMLSWLHGTPAANAPWTALEAAVPPQQFSQAGWNVDLRLLQDGQLQAQRQATNEQRGATLRLRLDR